VTQPVPTSLGRAAVPPGAIEIGWNDGRRSVYTPRLLRDACREQRGRPQPPPLLPVLAPGEVAPLAVTGMRPVGQYAYAIEFSDGHASGIYTLDYLRELDGEPPAAGG
jgi:DUF971 family protein